MDGAIGPSAVDVGPLSAVAPYSGRDGDSMFVRMGDGANPHAPLVGSGWLLCVACSFCVASWVEPSVSESARACDHYRSPLFYWGTFPFELLVASRRDS